MLVQITNKCDNYCQHCLQMSGHENLFMKDGLFQNVCLLHKSLECDTMLISGGEPTMHPRWFDMCCLAFEYVPMVILATNGNWLLWDNWDKKYEPSKVDIHKKRYDLIVKLLTKFKQFYVQVTSIPEFYPHHSDIAIAWNKFQQQHRDLDSKLLYADTIEAMASLGRAATNEECLELARENRRATSCFSGALVSAQTDLKDAISALESHASLCHPLIDWQGGMHWSESWLCPSFFTIPDHLLLDAAMVDQISESAHAWRPCGKCADYQKLLNNDYPKYVLAKHILGIPQTTEK